MRRHSLSTSSRLFYRVILACVALSLTVLIGCRKPDSAALVVSGRVEVDDAQVGSKIGGRVVRVATREGEMVKGGALLVKLDDDELTAQLDQAQAAANQAQAQLDLLLAGTRAEDIARAEAAAAARRAQLDLLRKGFRAQEIAEAQAKLDAAQSDLELARKNLERAQALFESDSIGRQELDQRQTAYEAAKSQAAQARERLALFQSGSRPEEINAAEAQLAEAEAELLRLRHGPRPEEIAAQRAALAAARANIELFRAQLDETSITAPFTALVDTMELEPGDLVRPDVPVATLNKLGCPWVRAYVPENRLGWVRPGQEVEVTVDSFPGRAFRGRVRRVAADAEFTPRNVQTTEKRAEQVFEMKVDIMGDCELVRPGMYADVRVPPPEAAAP